MLKLENVSKIYYTNGIVATGISKVNLELNIGEFVVITGESGSGKSTLLNVISGIDSYEEGEMYINGKETSHYTEKDFEEELNFTYIKDKARKEITREIDTRLQTKVKHKKLDREVSYEYLIRLEIYKLIKHLLEDEEYEGFKMWW